MPEGGPLPRVILVGNVNVDVLMGDLAPWPTPGTETLVDRYELRVGGAAGNTALALAPLGVRPELVAAVGEDGFGLWLEERLAAAGARLARVPAATALTVGLTHPDGQRTFVSYLGHLAHFPSERLAEALDGSRPGDLMLLCGYFMLPGLREAALGLAREARERGVVTLLDTGWPTEGWTPAVRREFLELAAAVDAVTPNREELLAATGEDDLEAALARPELRGCRLVVKLGADGGLLVDGREREAAGPPPPGDPGAAAGRRAHVPAPEVRVQDTVGAGDTFNAGLLAGLQRGMGWAEALGPAVRAASLAIASAPRRYPNWDEISATTLI